MSFFTAPRTPVTLGRYTIPLLLILMTSHVWLTTAHAKDRETLKHPAPIDFHIPAQALPLALTQFATQSRLFLVYKSKLASYRCTAQS